MHGVKKLGDSPQLSLENQLLPRDGKLEVMLVHIQHKSIWHYCTEGEELAAHTNKKKSESEWDSVFSPGDVLLDAVKAALGVISAHIGQVESKHLQFAGIFWPWYRNFLLKTKQAENKHNYTSYQFF